MFKGNEQLLSFLAASARGIDSILPRLAPFFLYPTFYLEILLLPSCFFTFFCVIETYSLLQLSPFLTSLSLLPSFSK